MGDLSRLPKDGIDKRPAGCIFTAMIAGSWNWVALAAPRPAVQQTALPREVVPRAVGPRE
jgi:hypothetical protein